MIDPASIRTASFSLTPTGYNPEEVDRFLAELADATSGSIDLAELRNASFSLTPTGYNPEEVDQFLGSIADQLADASSPQPESFQREEQPVAEYDDEHRYEPVTEVEHEPVAEADHEDEPEAEVERRGRRRVPARRRGRGATSSPSPPSTTAGISPRWPT